MTDPFPEDQRLVEISSKAYEHPADRAATAALQSIPMLDQVVRKLIEFGYERALRQVFLGGSVKLGSDQLPEVWAAHRAALARLDIKELPELYLTQFPITNAAAIGSERPMVVVNSRTVEVLDEQEVRTVLGHEAGHILSDHVLYRTALLILLSATGVGRMPMLAGRPRGHAGQPGPPRELPDADGARRWDHLPQARPRCVRPPGRRLRGVGAGVGQAGPRADRARPDARVPRQARVGADEVGPLGRLRPDRLGPVRPPRRPGRRARGGRRRRRVLRG